jgi:hypothetical protein
MDISKTLKDLIIHMIYFAMFFTIATILGFAILFMVMWDCLIFIVKRIGELLWLKKKKK